ncbi:unnamed protein product [Closterium sp. Naga37s-1]|nr:unnamed protein product [Closterium sp. Naga37s-1]
MADSCGYRALIEAEKIANPAPLGLASFALTTFVLSAHNAGWAPNHIWMGLALFYGGLGQILAGMWEFKHDNVFACTAFTSFGCFWMGLATFILLELLGWVPKEVVASALGWYLSGFMIFNTYMFLATLLMPKTVCITFFLLEITFVLLVIANFTPTNKNWNKAGGYVGVFTAIAAGTTSMIALINTVAKRKVIDTGRPFVDFGQEI